MAVVTAMNTKQDFWDQKAKTFPRYEEGEDNYEAGMLRRMREHGVDFRNATVLDVGCGSGMYTIRLAQEAARVTALDISDTMLRILHQDAQAQGLDNIDYVHGDWTGYTPRGVHDIVFCSMTPAIQSDEDRRKLLTYARHWLVFMGFAGRMDSDIMAGLYAHYEVTPRVFDNGTEMRLWLEANNVPHIAVPVDGQWVVTKSLEDTAHSCRTFLEQYGVTPDPAHLEAHLERFRTGDDAYTETTDYAIELLLCES